MAPYSLIDQINFQHKVKDFTSSAHKIHQKVYQKVANKIVKQKVRKIQKILMLEQIKGYCINCHDINLTGAKYSTNT